MSIPTIDEREEMLKSLGCDWQELGRIPMNLYGKSISDVWRSWRAYQPPEVVLPVFDLVRGRTRWPTWKGR